MCVCSHQKRNLHGAQKQKDQVYPLHVQKKIHSGTDPCLSCECDFCMNYMSICAESGTKNKLGWHFGQAVAANTSFSEPAGRNFGFLGTW